MQDEISVHQLAGWRQSDIAHTVLDVREPHERAICQIGPALHMPMSEIPARLDDVPRDIPVVVMCHHGMRSMSVTNFLRESGHRNVVNLGGGIDAWAREIDASMPRY